MLLKIAEMPKGIKLCKVLTYDKIAKKSSFIDGFPKPGEPIDHKIKMTPETALQESVPQSLITEAMTNACWKMVRTCLNDNGIGLAFPQIGGFKKLFIIRQDPEYFKAYFHPRFSVDINSKLATEMEGCLSVPGKLYPIARHTIILAEWLEVDGAGKLVQRSELLNDYPARVFQHEENHLQGISIVDRFRMQKTK